MLVIVNADDVGISREANEATFELLASGLVTSVTLLANSPCVEEAAKKLIELPECSTGIHLNLTEFEPLSSSRRLEPLLDENGHLYRPRILEARPDAALKSAVYEELSAQVERVLSLGIPLSHFDSHHHIHNIPWVFPIIKRLQRKFEIRKVRIAHNIFSSEQKIRQILRLKKGAYNFLLRNYFRTRTTTGMTDISTFISRSQQNNIRHKSVEILVHPGNLTLAHEAIMLKKEWGQRLPDNVRLISYNDL